MNEPLRIAHLADTHLGYRALGRTEPGSGRNQRAVDIERAFEQVIDDILTRDVDLVLHAGDVFHHTRPSWTTLSAFVRQMRKIEAAGLPCLVIAGNHDTPRMRQSGSVFDLLALALPGIRFVAGFAIEVWEPRGLDTVVHAVPHGALVNPDPAFVVLTPGKRNAIVTHGLAYGIDFRSAHEPGEEMLPPELLDPAADYVALGHYHLGGNPAGNAWYSGSTERTGWGDEKVEPGYNLVTLAAPGETPVVEHLTIPTRPMLTLTPIGGEGREARELADLVLDRARALDDPTAMVRIELHGASRPLRREVEGLVRRDLNDAVWDLRLFTASDLLEQMRERGSEGLPPLEELFGRFVAEQRASGAYDEAFAATFLERGRMALGQAQRSAEEAAAGEESAA
ncbi:MAG: DNA repair exonuclease [Thermomicrobiales bacterium]|nr:DNA repair exonuclease [Thermomicrobiales bacterium]